MTPLPSEDLERQVRRRAGAKLGWYAHACAYLLVNLLIYAMSVHGWGTRPWSVFPALGWGLGLVLHGVAVFALGAGSDLHERMVQREREQWLRHHQPDQRP